MKRRNLVCLAVIMLLGGWLAYDYFNGLTVQEVRISAILLDPNKPTRREIHFLVRSHFSEYPLVPAKVRRFFRMQPVVCFLQPDGTELVNDDVQSPCLLEQDEFNKKGKSHQNETSTFALPVYLAPDNLNPTQHFLKSLRANRGVWIRFKLGGHIFPPEVTAKPVFLDLGRYCKEVGQDCAGLQP